MMGNLRYEKLDDPSDVFCGVLSLEDSQADDWLYLLNLNERLIVHELSFSLCSDISVNRCWKEQEIIKNFTLQSICGKKILMNQIICSGQSFHVAPETSM